MQKLQNEINRLSCQFSVEYTITHTQPKTRKNRLLNTKPQPKTRFFSVMKKK